MAQALIEVRQPNKYDAEKASDLAGLKCLDASRATQDEAEEADINTLIKRFNLDYTMPQIEKLPINADFVGNMTFQDAQNALREAQETFDSLHADIRKRFGHDPAEFVNFASDPANLPELRKMKLAPEAPLPPPEPTPILVRMEPEKKDTPPSAKQG